MNTQPKAGEATVRAFNFHLLDPAPKIKGHDHDWQVPAAVISAPEGFGEAHWTDAGPETVIAIKLSGAPVICRWGPRNGIRSDAGASLALQPKGAPNHFSAQGSISFAHIYLSEAFVDRVADALGSSASFHGRLRDDIVFRRDFQFEELVLTYVRRACLDSDSPSRLEIEARSTLVAEYLLRRLHQLAPCAQTSETGALAPWQVRRATEYLQANLAQDVSLAEIAATAKLSPFHFARTFKKTVGLPPYAYLRRLRVEQARALLESDDLPVTEIAARVGYDSPQALTRAFHKESGRTPTAYRKERRK